jgi:hypothetical protein
MLTDIEELTKLMFEFEAEMDKHQAQMEDYWEKSRQHEKMKKDYENKHANANCDYKEAYRQLQIIRKQLKEAVDKKG